MLCNFLLIKMFCETLNIKKDTPFEASFFTKGDIFWLKISDCKSSLYFYLIKDYLILSENSLYYNIEIIIKINIYKVAYILK